MVQPSPYPYRLKQFQMAYCSSMDWKTYVIKLHETVIQCARRASLQNIPLKKFVLETKALRILNYLTANICDAKTMAGADPEACDGLAMVYHSCSIHLSNGDDQEAVKLMSELLRN